jgi:hypothetical protein
MEISIIYSKDKPEHRKTATFVRKAVKNLGLAATIIERESKMALPRVVVDGFDLINGLNEPALKSKEHEVSYELIEKALEQNAWASY